MNKPICPKCGTIQLYPRKHNGVFVCTNFDCKQPLSQQEKKPETPYIPMNKYGQTRSMK